MNNQYELWFIYTGWFHSSVAYKEIKEGNRHIEWLKNILGLIWKILNYRISTQNKSKIRHW